MNTVHDDPLAVRDGPARDALVIQYRPLVGHVLRRLRGIGTVHRYRAEVYGAGCLALVRAASRWREDSGVKFVTFAYIHVRYGVLNEVRLLERERARGFPFDGYEPAAPEPEASASADYGRLYRALGRLAYRHRRTLALRFGLDGMERLTLEEAAPLLGVSKERVRQLQEEALGRLAHHLAELSV